MKLKWEESWKEKGKPNRSPEVPPHAMRSPMPQFSRGMSEKVCFGASLDRPKPAEAGSIVFNDNYAAMPVLVALAKCSKHKPQKATWI